MRKSESRPFSRSAVALILLFLFFVRVADAEVPSNLVRFSNLPRFVNGLEDGVKVAIDTPDGIEVIDLHRRTPFSALQINGEGGNVEANADSPLILLQGRRRRSGRASDEPSGVGGYILNGQMHVNFFGRRGRGYELILPISAKSSPRLAHIPRSRLKTRCGVSDSARSPTKRFLRMGQRATTRYIEIATDSDAEYQKRFGAGANTNIQTILNNVEAVYSDQLNVRFTVKTQGSYSEVGSQPYTSLNASTLLAQFREKLRDSSRLEPYDLAHLFTGKVLNNNVGGIAYKGVLCYSNEYNVGLSSASGSAIIDWITTAHEIGHNIDASHDFGDAATGPNDPAYQGHVMNAQASSQNATFSSYSLAEMNSFLDDHPSCLSGSGSEGGGKGGLLDLSMSANAKGKAGKTLKFTANLLLANGIAPCTMTLYGANKESQLSEASELESAEKVSVITTQSIEPGTELKLQAQIKNGKSSTKKSDFLQAEVECALGATGTSERVTIKSNIKKAKKVFSRLTDALELN